MALRCRTMVLGDFRQSCQALLGATARLREITHNLARGELMRNLWHASAAVAAALGSVLVAGMAAGAPINFTQSYYFKYGPPDDFAARAGADSSDQAFPNAFVAARQ